MMLTSLRNAVPLAQTAPAQVDQQGIVADVEQVIQRLQLERTFAETPISAWLMLLGGIVGGIVIGKLAEALLRRLAQRGVKRDWHARATLLIDAARPANLAVIAMGLSVGLTPIAMSPPVKDFVLDALAFLYILALGWFLYNAVNLVDVAVRRLFGRRHTNSHLDQQLAPIVRKALRLFLVVVFALFTAENVFSADIGAWLAGLGIAGLAVSLAAQDSLKNLLGSITVFMDRPFMVGDQISFDGHTGTVEQIGFRSTTIRTMNGEVVSIPNGKIVDSSLHNIGRRPHIRRVLDVTLTYDTPVEKIEEAKRLIHEILRDPEIGQAFDWEKTPPRVLFADLAESSLNVRVYYWFTPPDFWAYMEHADRFNFKLLRALNDAGIEFAFPTRTVHLTDDPKRRLRVETMEGADGSDGMTSDGPVRRSP